MRTADVSAGALALAAALFLSATAFAGGGVFSGSAEDSSKARAEDMSRAAAKNEAAKALGTLLTNYDKPDKVSTDCTQVDSSTRPHEKDWSCTTHWVINN